ncbi:aquaporin [Arthrobacter sp. Hiyo1]|nr:aquaporin [Arthrobacter sp. Hiyo1]
MTTTVSAPSSRGTRLLARASAEALGTLFLVVIGLGVLIFINPQAVPMPASLASGLTVTAAMLAFGYLSGGHFNPAITVGHLVAGRMKLVDGAAYLGARLWALCWARWRFSPSSELYRGSRTAGLCLTRRPPASVRTPASRFP